MSATVSRHARRRLRLTGPVGHYSDVAYDHQERHRDLVWRGADSLVDFDGSVFSSSSFYEYFNFSIDLHLRRHLLRHALSRVPSPGPL